LVKLERMLNSGGLMELFDEIDRLRKDLQGLRGELEESRQEVVDLGARQRETQTNFDSRLLAVEKPVAPQIVTGQVAPPGAGPAGAIGLSPLHPPGGAAATANPNAVGAASPSEIVDEGGGTAVGPGKGDKASKLATKGAGEKPGVEAVKAVDYAAAKGTSAAATPVQLTGEGGDAAEAAYKEATNLLKAGEYQRAIKSFNGYLEKYPRHTRVDVARYWLGESYSMMRKFDQAIAEYRQVLQEFPQSRRAANAKLKIGISLQEMGKTDQARKEFEELRVVFPGSTEARLAEDRLQSLQVQKGH
jgi:tol-pal system protein YbgF